MTDDIALPIAAPTPKTPEQEIRDIAERNYVALRADLAAAIGDMLDGLAVINQILAADNSAINSNPAIPIKALARELRTLGRQVVRLARIVADQTMSTDVGT